MGPALWQDSIAKIPSNSIDGILYDTYPLNKEEQHIHQFEFLAEARRILKPGGILTYCNLTSIGVLKNQYEDWGGTSRRGWRHPSRLIRCCLALPA